MTENKNEHTEQIMDLTELMVQTLQATIDADRSTADQYYRILEEYAFKEKTDENAPEELQMVDFKIVTAEGQTQIISMPKLILMPVPMLHIDEASFELEGNMCINTSEETDNTDNQKEILENAKRSGNFVTSPKLHNAGTSAAQFTSNIRRARQLQMRFNSASGPDKESENAQSTTNMKISVKLKQSDMPSGLANMLQVINNNIQIKNQ